MPKFIFLLFIFLPSVVLSQNISANKQMMEERKEMVLEKWEDLENNFQRRADLVPQIVSLLKNTFPENSPLLAQATSARDSANVEFAADYDRLDLYSINSTQQKLAECLEKLYTASEEYQDLKANPSYINLFYELSSTENRIYISIEKYNDAIKNYNNAVDVYNNSVEEYNKLALQKNEELLQLELYLVYMNH